MNKSKVIKLCKNMIKCYENTYVIEEGQVGFEDVEILGFLDLPTKYVLLAHVPLTNKKYYNLVYNKKTKKIKSYTYDKLSKFIFSDKKKDRNRRNYYGK